MRRIECTPGIQFTAAEMERINSFGRGLMIACDIALSPGDVFVDFPLAGRECVVSRQVSRGDFVAWSDAVELVYRESDPIYSYFFEVVAD